MTRSASAEKRAAKRAGEWSAARRSRPPAINRSARPLDRRQALDRHRELLGVAGDQQLAAVTGGEPEAAAGLATITTPRAHASSTRMRTPEAMSSGSTSMASGEKASALADGERCTKTPGRSGPEPPNQCSAAAGLAARTRGQISSTKRCSARRFGSQPALPKSTRAGAPTSRCPEAASWPGKGGGRTSMRADSGASARSRSPSAADSAIVAAAAASAARSAPRESRRLAQQQRARDAPARFDPTGARDRSRRSGRAGSGARAAVRPVQPERSARRPGVARPPRGRTAPRHSLAVVELARHPAGELRAVVAGQRIGAARDRRGERREDRGSAAGSRPGWAGRADAALPPSPRGRSPSPARRA